MNLLFSLALSVFCLQSFSNSCYLFMPKFLREFNSLGLIFFFLQNAKEHVYRNSLAKKKNMLHSISRHYFQNLKRFEHMSAIRMCLCFLTDLLFHSFHIQTPYNRLINVLQAVFLAILLLHSYFMCYLRAICLIWVQKNYNNNNYKSILFMHWFLMK